MNRKDERTHILLVDTPPAIEAGLVERLGDRHRVSVQNGRSLDASAWSSVPDVDIVVHGLPSVESGPDSDLDAVDRATRGTWNVLTGLNPRAAIFLSTMRLFETYDTVWSIDEDWLPEPAPEPGTLCTHLAEVVSREVARARRIDTWVLRLDRVVRDVDRADRADDDEIHLDDALSLITAAVATFDGNRSPQWRAAHGVTGHGRYRLGVAAGEPLLFTPSHVPADRRSSPSGTPAEVPADTTLRLAGLSAPGRVTLFGAGGPLGAVAADHLSRLPDVQMLLSDVRPLAVYATAPPQSTGAPRPVPPVAPHAERIVDVTDPAQVLDAARGADCLVNCAVVRHEADAAFRVNVLGAYNVMRAAVALGIPRVVHTGPAQILLPDPIGYAADRRVPSNAPARSGDDVYFLTKSLAQEICRVFAEHHRLACPILLYTKLLTPEETSGVVHPFAISWEDAGRAVAAAASVSSLPEPAPIVNVRAPSPHGRYREDEIAPVLGWTPQDRLDRLWTREHVSDDRADRTDSDERRE